MFALTAANKYEYYAKPCDMRKGFDTLCGLVANELGRKTICGDVFVFINKPRNTIKLLHWEVDGLDIPIDTIPPIPIQSIPPEWAKSR